MSGRFVGVRIGMALIAAAAVFACAGAPVLSPGVCPEVEGMAKIIAPDERVTSTAQIDIVSPQGQYPLRAALILQKPAYLRLELLPVIGTPDLFLAATPEAMNIFIPSRREYYTGKPTAGNMAHFLPWTLDIGEAVMILTGDCPPLSGQNVQYERYADDRALRVRMKTALGDSQTVWLNPDGRPAKLVRNGIDGREMYSVLYEDYRPDDRLAGKITIHINDAAMSVTVRYSDVQIGKAHDGAVFALPVPAGVKIIKLD